MDLKSRGYFQFAYLLSVILFLGPGFVRAQSTFDGGGDGSTWEDPNNWDPTGLPDPNADPNTIPFPGNANINDGFTVSLSSTQAIAELDIDGDQGSFGGTLNHSAGSLTGSGWMKVGFGLSDTGNYNLSGSASASGWALGFIGRDQGVGIVDASGSSSFSTSGMIVGSSNGTGTINVSDTASVSSGGGEFKLGENAGAQGTLNVSGSGTVTGGNFKFGQGGIGNVSVTGSGSISGAEIKVSEFGTSLTEVTDNGMLTASGDIKIGDGGLGTLNVSGNATVTGGAVRFGDGNGTGVLNLSGSGTIDAGTGDIVFENNGGSVANINGGSITSGQFTMKRNATVNQTSGSVAVDNWVSIGDDPNNTASYNISGGSVNSGLDWITVGENGLGELNVSGPASVAASGNGIVVGRESAGDGLLSIDGSSASVSATEFRAGLNGDPNASASDPNFAGGASQLSWTADAGGLTEIDSSTSSFLLNTLLTVDLTSWSQFADIGTGTTVVELTLIDNTTAATDGVFAGIAENDSISIGGAKTGTISYVGGSDGFDVTLSVLVSSLAGDFNGDGRVDAVDFLEWQRNPGIGDLSDWEANYGTPLNSAVNAVPEPTTMSLLVLCLGCLTARIRK